MGNNQGNFQLHRFTRRDNTAKSFRGATFFDSHCRCCCYCDKMRNNCFRSPGGTPLRVQRDPADFDCSDPAALIARALRKKFAAQRRNCDSPDAHKYNDSPVSSVVDGSDSWSPSPASTHTKPAPVFSLPYLPLSVCVQLLLSRNVNTCTRRPLVMESDY